MTDDAFDIFAELEAELAKAAVLPTLKAKSADLAKRINNTKLPHEARAVLRAEREALEAQIVKESWLAVSAVALFTEQSCDGCGSTHRIFVQFMERQTLITNPSTRRMVRVTGPGPDLPKETVIQQTFTHICPDCAEDHGFPPSGVVDFSRHTTFLPSPTYQQEDLNNGTPEEN